MRLSRMMIEASTYRLTLRLENATGNGADRLAHKGASAMHQGSCVRGVSTRLLTLLLGGILFQMMLTVDPLAWMPYPTLSNYSRKCVEKHKALINQLTLQWLLTSSLRTNPHPCFQAARPMLRE